MKTNKTYRQQMRDALRGKGRRFFLITLVYQLVISGAGRLLNGGLDVLLTSAGNEALFKPAALFISSLLIQPLLAVAGVGMFRLAMSVYGGENPSFSALLLPGKLFRRAVKLKYLIAVVCYLPIVAVMVLGYLAGDFVALLIFALLAMFAGLFWMIKKQLDYVVSDFVLLTEPDLSAKEILREARMRIRGCRWQYICLIFSISAWSLVPIAVIAFAVKNDILAFVLNTLISAAVLPRTLSAGAAFFADLKRKKK